VSFITDQLAPTFPLYVTQQDMLQVSVLNFATGLTQVAVNVRFLTPDGQVSWWALQTGSVPNDGNLHSFQFPLAEGWIMSAVATEAAGTFNTDKLVYTVVELVKEGTDLVPVYFQLCNGYQYACHHPTWPAGNNQDAWADGGALLSVTGTVPAAGANISLAVPRRLRWKIRGMRFSLTTSATAGNRGVLVSLSDGVSDLWHSTAPFNQPASTTQAYSVGPGVAPSAIGGQDVQLGLPVDVTLPSLFQVNTECIGLLAGDQFTAPVVLVEQWLSP
jgi:hypothetical protein